MTSFLLTTTDDKPELKDLFRQLYSLAAQWKSIGTMLGVQANVLKAIKTDEVDVHDCLQAVLSEYLKQVDPSPTWKDVIDAVDATDPNKAKEMETKLARA